MKIINDYKQYSELRKTIERYESMTKEEWAAEPKTEVEVDWTEEEVATFTTAAERVGLTLSEFVEDAIYEFIKKELKEYEDDENK